MIALTALCLFACGQAPPEPYIPCLDDTQCPGGRCVDGLCVADDSDATPGDGVLSGDDGRAATCKTVADCAKIDTPCLTAICDLGTCSVAPLPNETTCTTQSVCPASGACNGGNCLPAGAACDDQNPCTADQCTGTGCNHVNFPAGTFCAVDDEACSIGSCEEGVCDASVAPTYCKIAGTCYLDGEVASDDPCRVCIADVSQTAWTFNAGGSCDDGDPCTHGTVCESDKSCTGSPVTCDDDNPCTDDSCGSQTGCIYLSNSDPCTDGDPCTLNGKCDDGSCEFTETIDCDDANPCTDDGCTAGLGCVFLPNTATCVADADPCTDDLCLQGTCVAITAASVCTISGMCVAAGSTASGNPCLVCDPNAATDKWTVLDKVKCDDGNACTALDACKTGTCSGKLLACKDNSACTEDKCDPVTGCTFVAIGGMCDDGDACTQPDVCVGGVCKGTPLTALDCDDSNPCTIDTCIPSVGCNHKPSNDKCDDNDPCTKYDFCSAGKCTAGKLVCPCEFNSDCDDQNVCTADSCVEGVGCDNVAIKPPTPCSDGDACTVADTCNSGVCKGTALNCDDGNPCTQTVCASHLGCVIKPLQGKSCDDASACTAGDLCIDGLCKGTPKSCDDGNPCTDDSCAATSGSCVHAPTNDGQVCSGDGLVCTLDVCIAGKCDHSEVSGDFCLINGTCISGGTQSKQKFCVACLPKLSQKQWSVSIGTPCDDSNPCTVGTQCASSGDCLGAPLSCDDSNPCTTNACDPNGPNGAPCVFINISGPCDDGDACTTKETCTMGACLGSAVQCDDGLICTIDSCDPKQGCATKPAADGLACKDDGLPCTSDLCSAGVCDHPPTKGWCAIAGACVAEGKTAASVGNGSCKGCVPSQSGTQWTPLTSGACDDGEPCTGADICINGGCVGDPQKACDDNNPCTLDSCSKASGCKWTNQAGTCEDGDPCTVGDQCVAGACKSGTSKTCVTSAKDEASCLLNVCLPEAGGCTLKSVCGPMHSCVESLCLTKPAGASLAGAVAVQIPGASSPRRPTLAWQETSPGPLGSVPQLWLAVESNACDTKLTSNSNLLTVRFPTGESKVSVNTLQTKPPLGGNLWCMGQPLLRPHPTSTEVLVLTWLEGGDLNSVCPWDTNGGRTRVALAGVNGHALALSGGALCGPNGQLSSHRPDAVLWSAQGSIGTTSIGQLGGALLREGTNGRAVAFAGDVVGDWGGSKGTTLPPLKMTGWVEQPTTSRPAVAAFGNSHAALTTSALKNAQGTSQPVLSVAALNQTGAVVSSRTVLFTGGPLAGAAEYTAVEADYDPTAKRIGVIVSGKVKQGAVQTAFLAFARVHPDQSPATAPQAVITAPLTNNGVFDAFRVAHIPKTSDFLVVWATPGSSVLKASKITPKDDYSFTVTDLGVIATNFGSQTSGAAPDSSGGLSDLVVAPDGLRYSVAFESLNQLYVLTAQL